MNYDLYCSLLKDNFLGHIEGAVIKISSSFAYPLLVFFLCCPSLLGLVHPNPNPGPKNP